MTQTNEQLLQVVRDFVRKFESIPLVKDGDFANKEAFKETTQALSALAELEARLRWIPVSERQPDLDGGPVITKSRFKRHDGSFVYTVNGESYMKPDGQFENDEGLPIKFVVAWMPQPPAGEQE